MEIVFTNPGVDYMIHQIMEFQGKEETAFWSEALYHFFPQLDKVHTAALSFPEKKKYIDSVCQESADHAKRSLFNSLEPGTAD